MKNYFLTSLLLLILAAGHAQSTGLVNPESIKLINSTITKKTEYAVLFTTLHPLAISDIREMLSSDTIDGLTNVKQNRLILSIAERKQVDNYLAALNKFRWTFEFTCQLNFYDFNLVERDTGYWQTLAFAPPILLRDNTIGIFYKSRGGSSDFSVYKKENGLWKFWFLTYFSIGCSWGDEQLMKQGQERKRIPLY